MPFPSPMHESEKESEVPQSCPTQRPHGLQPTRLLHPWDFPGNSTGVRCHCLLPPLVTMEMQIKTTMRYHFIPSQGGNGNPSSILAWKIPWTEEPGRLQSMGSLSRTRLSNFTFHFHALEKEMATHSSVLAWRIPGTAEPGGLPSMGSHRVGHD